MWVVAAVAILVGLVMSLGAFQVVRDGRVTLDGKQADIKELHRMKADIVSYRAAKDLFDGLESKQPPPIKEVMKVASLGLKLDDFTVSRDNSISDWTLSRYKLTFDDAEMGLLMGVLKKAESLRPPLRLTEYVVNASGVPGRGRVSLAMEGLAGR